MLLPRAHVAAEQRGAGQVGLAGAPSLLPCPALGLAGAPSLLPCPALGAGPLARSTGSLEHEEHGALIDGWCGWRAWGRHGRVWGWRGLAGCGGLGWWQRRSGRVGWVGRGRVRGRRGRGEGRVGGRRGWGRWRGRGVWRWGWRGRWGWVWRRWWGRGRFRGRCWQVGWCGVVGWHWIVRLRLRVDATACRSEQQQHRQEHLPAPAGTRLPLMRLSPGRRAAPAEELQHGCFRWPAKRGGQDEPRAAGVVGRWRRAPPRAPRLNMPLPQRSQTPGGVMRWRWCTLLFPAPWTCTAFHSLARARATRQRVQVALQVD